MNLTRLVYIALYLCTSVFIVQSSDVLSTVEPEPLSRDSRDLACTNVRYSYTERGFSNSDVPLRAISGKRYFFLNTYLFNIKCMKINSCIV